MTRVLAVALSVLALLAVLAPPAAAQAPSPKVTITGFMDHVTTWNKNVSIVDNNLDKSGDTEWYMRSRFRPDLTAELGTTKVVFGLEIDAAFGATGSGGSDIAAPQTFGTTHSHDLNTDTAGVLEVKWMYTEFNFPLWTAWRWRVGAQPFAATYKPGVLATGDFGGINWVFNINPMVKVHATYVQVEEESTGYRDGWPNGEDFAVIGSVEITPIKGWDLRPIVSWFSAEGTTSGSARIGRGGVTNAAVFFPGGPGVGDSAREHRFTFGIDGRIRVGPFSFDPTLLYQLGWREMAQTPGFGFRAGSNNALKDQDMHSFLVDLRGGFQAGPLLVEVAGIYTPGNKAHHDLRNPDTDVHYYQVIDADSGFYGTWAEHFALGIDYFRALREAGGAACQCNAIGYDKYGLIRFGARASYAVTPAFSPRIAVTTNWTAEEVDTDGIFSTAAGITPSTTTQRFGNLNRGDHRYMGTEIDLGFQYRFAPGVAFDAVYAYTFAGPALAHAAAIPNAPGTVGSGSNARNDANNVENIQSFVMRLRYTF